MRAKIQNLKTPPKLPCVGSGLNCWIMDRSYQSSEQTRYRYCRCHSPSAPKRKKFNVAMESREQEASHSHFPNFTIFIPLEHLFHPQVKVCLGSTTREDISAETLGSWWKGLGCTNVLSGINEYRGR
ncbi:hypothetical protein V6N13_030949 [Hibiscus sabdariffa]|uniref:Uncharacterized protein n=2 Tax=Hibiscus sabdariffa TaxID=183260 RepID=A0ABR1ZGP8_9ROSI